MSNNLNTTSSQHSSLENMNPDGLFSDDDVSNDIQTDGFESKINIKNVSNISLKKTISKKKNSNIVKNKKQQKTIRKQFPRRKTKNEISILSDSDEEHNNFSTFKNISLPNDDDKNNDKKTQNRKRKIIDSISPSPRKKQKQNEDVKDLFDIIEDELKASKQSQLPRKKKCLRRQKFQKNSKPQQHKRVSFSDNTKIPQSLDNQQLSHNTPNNDDNPKTKNTIQQKAKKIASQTDNSEISSYNLIQDFKASYRHILPYLPSTIYKSKNHTKWIKFIQNKFKTEFGPLDSDKTNVFAKFLSHFMCEDRFLLKLLKAKTQNFFELQCAAGTKNGFNQQKIHEIKNNKIILNRIMTDMYRFIWKKSTCIVEEEFVFQYDIFPSENQLNIVQHTLNDDFVEIGNLNVLQEFQNTTDYCKYLFNGSQIPRNVHEVLNIYQGCSVISFARNNDDKVEEKMIFHFPKSKKPLVFKSYTDLNFWLRAHKISTKLDHNLLCQKFGENKTNFRVYFWSHNTLSQKHNDNEFSFSFEENLHYITVSSQSQSQTQNETESKVLKKTRDINEEKSNSSAHVQRKNKKMTRNIFIVNGQNIRTVNVLTQERSVLYTRQIH